MTGAATWCLEHTKAIDSEFQFCRSLYTNGHMWKAYEVHDNYVKKTDFFKPTTGPLFYNDYDLMLSVIGLIRFVLQIRENMVESHDNIEFIE